MDGDIRFLTGIGAGLWLFWRGFKELRIKRLIAGLATSKIRSLAMGTVELAGYAKPAQALEDPIYKLPCVFYQIEVKEKVGSGKYSRWTTIHRDTSQHFPFYLQDDTGSILVAPGGAALYCDKDVDVTVNQSLLGGLLPKTQNPLEAFASRFRRSCGPLHITAYILREYEPVYVLGYATTDGNGLMIQKSPEGLFIIADKTEKEMLTKLGWLAWAQIIGGPILCLFCLWAYLR